MKKVKSWEKFNENQAVWGAGSFNNGQQPTSLMGGSPIQPNDPQLTTDAFDRNKSNIINAQLRLNQITASIFKDGTMKSSDDLELSMLKILGISKNQSNGIDILIEFKFDPYEETFFGKFKNWASYNNTSFKSNFQHRSTIFSKKIEAILKKALQKWFEPDPGEYRLLADECRVYDKMGTVYELKAGARITVTDVQLENTKPMIHMQMGKNLRYITDLDYYFFNWWFERIPKK